ncbi:MAG: hypothetical protein AVDCRST_MAG49-538 [uncultured Thermomicrobiales bacterium]|uniref:Uncharacterized protein n=1 Tax=uncultured Thermomicrobiales bacterium TaxID=1645740 RepID=A0A6J4U385_9BACT|nr:MAG: hypothetical protein AVDCRST_MAG49-538 [uncultured Thermomicrobiales bacterium]
MRRTALGRRVGQVRSRAPGGCPACRAVPPIVILHEEDPEPAASCPDCGTARTGTTWVRITRTDRGPA